MQKSFWANKRVLVTGHTGFKGSWLALWLGSLGAHVYGYALSQPSTASLWQEIQDNSDIISTIADIRDADTLTSTIQQIRPEVVFHLAAQSLVRASYADPVATYATNVMGTVHLLDAIRHQPSVRAVVVVTSDKCYENRESLWGYRENEALGGHDPYSSSKACAELVSAALRASFFDTAKGHAAIATARAGNVIGGGDWAQGRIVPDTVRALMGHEDLYLRNPHAIRPWQHVLEPLAGYLELAEALWHQPSAFAQAWNFGPAERDAVAVEHIVLELAQLWGKPVTIKTESAPQPHEAGVLKLDSAKARHQLGWKTRLELPLALAWTMDWYKAHAAGAHAHTLCLSQIQAYLHTP